MALDPYTAMVHGLQAMRRGVERDRSLIGALGVAAEPLPHQLTNVARLLGAPELRHLLADGVGLGKTVQTLMLMNALRIQDPDHRTLLVVPEHLANQWIGELATRGHCGAGFLGDETAAETDEQPIRLIRPAALGAYLNGGQERYDLLVLDEPQTFTVAQRDALARARPFAQFVALTATPEFGRAGMLHWFMTMLEPLRVGPEDDPLRAIRADETAAVSQGTDGRTIFERDAFARRICRWSRKDWPQYLPRRDYVRADIPTFAREAALAATARRVLAAPPDGGDPIARARALHRVGRAAREALATLPEGFHPPAAGEDPENGDSRLDALLDRLAMLRCDDPGTRVLVVAGDNATVARLERILPDYLSVSADEKRPGIGRLGRGDQSTGDIETAIRRNDDAVGGFVKGENEILLLGDWAEAGLNLHHGCENLVFYSCPWNARSVDQLVGRLDRLRKGAGDLAASGRDPGRIGIHTITWAGSPEADVVDGLERLGVFERPSPPMSVERAAAIEDRLADLASGRRKAQALAELELVGADGSGEMEASGLAHLDPYTCEEARALHLAIVGRTPSKATMVADRKVRGAHGTEESALCAWLEMLAASRLFEIRTGSRDVDTPDARHITAWYGDNAQASTDGMRPFFIDRFERRYEGDKRSSWRAGCEAFLLNRSKMSDPPRRTVTDKEGVTRSLTFFDHGDALHEELCEAMIAGADGLLSQDRVPVVSVRYPSGHRALEDTRPLLMTVGTRHAMLPVVENGTFDALLSDADRRDRSYLRRRLVAAARADERWFRLLCPTRLIVEGIYTVPGTSGFEAVSTDHVEAILDPRIDEGRVTAFIPPRPSDAATRLQSIAKKRRQKVADMGVRVPSQSEIDHRLILVEAEGDRAAARETMRAIRIRSQATSDPNQARLVEGRAVLIDKLAATNAASTAWRLHRLRQTPAKSPARIWQVIVQPVGVV